MGSKRRRRDKRSSGNNDFSWKKNGDDRGRPQRLQELEGEPKGKFNLAFRVQQHGPDLAEIATREVAVRLIELRRVGDVVELSPELGIEALADREVLEQRKIQILAPRPVEGISRCCTSAIVNTPGRRHFGESSRVEPAGDVVHLAQFAYLIR